MQNEREWVESLRVSLSQSLSTVDPQGRKLFVESGIELPYTYQVLGYDGKQPDKTDSSAYQTDLLISEGGDGSERWIPRVVIECKLNNVTTHDALTYSTKAYSHKQVHPYLRYGIFIAGFEHVPARLLRHGHFFDFMAACSADNPPEEELLTLIRLLQNEVESSRMLQATLTDRSHSRERYRLFHRPLVFERCSKVAQRNQETLP